MLIVALLFCIFGLQASAETLIFEDNFDSFDFNKWQHEITMAGGGNWEFQMYWNNRSNSFVKDGSLHIKPTLMSGHIGENNVRSGYTMDVWGSSPPDYCTQNSFYGCSRTSNGVNILNPILSARLRTVNSFSFKYGRVEFRAKLPKGDWIWPALWMLPKHNEYGNWPASGEIDIMETRGNMNYPFEKEGGIESIESTLHWGPGWPENAFQLTHKVFRLPSGTFNDDFHTFGLYWSDKELYTYVDTPTNKVLNIDLVNTNFWDWGKFPQTYENPWLYGSNHAPFDKEFYLIMNVAVGGTSGFFLDGVGGKPWSDKSTVASSEFYNAKSQWLPTWDQKGDGSSMVVDWVRVWSLDNVNEAGEGPFFTKK